jgi:hypothetical protein
VLQGTSSLGNSGVIKHNLYARRGENLKSHFPENLSERMGNFCSADLILGLLRNAYCQTICKMNTTGVSVNKQIECKLKKAAVGVYQWS